MAWDKTHLIFWDFISVGNYLRQIDPLPPIIFKKKRIPYPNKCIISLSKHKKKHTSHLLVGGSLFSMYILGKKEPGNETWPI